MNLFCHLSRLDIKTILVPANTFMILCSLERPAAGTATFVLQAPSSTRLYLCCMRRIKVASLTQIVWLVPGNKIHRFHFLVQTRQLDTFERNVNVFFFSFVCMQDIHFHICMKLFITPTCALPTSCFCVVMLHVHSVHIIDVRCCSRVVMQ